MLKPLTRQLVYAHPNSELYYYDPLAPPSLRHADPILLIFAQINRPTILDLHPTRSFIRSLLNQGLEVFFLNWRYPSHLGSTLADYIFTDIHQAVESAAQYSANKKVHLCGICQGGYFCACYISIFGEKIASFIPIVTPIDFCVPQNRLFQICRYLNLEEMAAFSERIPGVFIRYLLDNIAPFHLSYKKFKAQKKYVQLQNTADQEIFQALNDWSEDYPDQNSGVFKEFIQTAVQQNSLVTGDLQIGSHRIKLSALTMPILNIYATQDHLCPVSSVTALSRYHNSHCYREHAFEGGHVGVFASETGIAVMPPVIRQWVKTRSD